MGKKKKNKNELNDEFDVNYSNSFSNTLPSAKSTKSTDCDDSVLTSMNNLSLDKCRSSDVENLTMSPTTRLKYKFNKSPRMKNLSLKFSKTRTDTEKYCIQDTIIKINNKLSTNWLSEFEYCLNEHIPDDKECCGLKNMGNTCFMNCILQCMAHISPILIICFNRQKSNITGLLFNAFSSLIDNMWSQDDNKPITPYQLKIEIDRITDTFDGFDQEDCSEFLIYLLQGLHDDIQKSLKFTKPDELFNKLKKPQNCRRKSAMKCWKNYLDSTNHSYLIDIFVGQYKSQLKCLTCSTISNTYDPFWMISLPIKRRLTNLSLLDCFELFTQTEKLDGPDKAYCSNCKCIKKSTKNLLIEKFPKVLNIQLKRFTTNGKKIHSHISIPFTNLNLTPFYAKEDSINIYYDLIGMCVHTGNLSGGHYYSYCRHPIDKNVWSVFNDSIVSNVNFSCIKSSMNNAYILFYELKNFETKI
ncbi:hypothetical protein A3Q56_01447 [Intoshia linei]|uniref:Ubiquitin carboxyl-terminal hydrolase n=1 Tax=Intoshia linei TaxID=1819745 RepID=A0A177B9F2_9BILA|nr:hypothetical protein A3Q56_01447 [Intoshia linei]